LNETQLIEEQAKNPEISKLLEMALTEDEVASVPIGCFIRAGVLMRKWRPPEVSADEEWAVVYQVVVPPSYRQEILSLGHETPMASHLVVNKTYDKIITHFYWPGLRQDVAQFCRSCHTCQVVGKTNQKIPVAPLKPITAFEEPFSKVIIDCVGPEPKTKA
jgi:hypothetical protein